jgi:adenine-specific DNA-methyltransferase
LVNENNVRLFNWHKDIKEENIPIAAVKDNIDKFYQYLLTKSYKSEKDIVPFVIDIFKQFRTYTTEASNPVKALNLLFAMLASIEDENAENLNREKWGISEFHLPAGFNSYIERFRQGVNNITPDLNLILRHSSGALFQEAQKEVLFLILKLTYSELFREQCILRSYCIPVFITHHLI